MISEEDKKDVHNLFDNIFVHASPEGFCGAFQIIDDQQSTKFMQKSSTTFLKSYLPIYSECVLLDLASFQLINRKHKNNLHELSEQFRELKLTQILPISRYSHLLQLKRIINGALSIMPKIESVSNYIDNIKEERNRNQERMLNSLLGFMGVGQVLFAIGFIPIRLHHVEYHSNHAICTILFNVCYHHYYTYKTMDQKRIGNHILLPVFAFFALS